MFCNTNKTCYVKTLIIDINECDTGVHNCDHFCHNNVGSYMCTCEKGFYLIDEETCVGIVESFILFCINFFEIKYRCR